MNTKFTSVYLQDGIPSAAAIGPLIRQCLWELVEQIDVSDSAAILEPHLENESKRASKKRRRAMRRVHYDDNSFFHNVALYFDKVRIHIIPFLNTECKIEFADYKSPLPMYSERLWPELSA